MSRRSAVRTMSARAADSGAPRRPLLLLLMSVLVSVSVSAGARPGYIVHEFSEAAPAEKLNHLVVDENTGRVYVGAINRLFQLSGDLQTVVSERTGPQDDDPECSPANECPVYVVKRPTDNVNKALVIDKKHGNLIVCGSLFQGRCQVRNLHNISVVEVEAEEAVVANNETASTVVFIAPGPPRPPQTHVLYVGVTYTGGARAPYRNEVPAVASRSLDRDRMFGISEVAVTTGTRMSINSLARERYYINYVYGFGSDGFSYFLTTQMRRSNELSPYISKLVRVCQDDPHYYSYTEIPIDCIDSAGIKYNLAQAAHVASAGPHLASKLSVSPQSDVLYAVFSVSETSEGENSNKPTNRSALCVYPLKAIRQTFTRNIMECYQGKADRGLEFISPGKKCVSTKVELLEQVGEDFCGMDVNTPIGGSRPVTSVAVLTFDALLTSVAATTTGDFNVVFAGTADGHLRKVVMEADPGSLDRQVSATQYADLPVQPGHKVLPDLRFDPRQHHLYVMTSSKVSKVKVQECHQYTTCSECLGARDPYCGWCSLENKCSIRSDCQDAAKDVLYWINYKSDRCTTIESVSPHQLQATTARTLTLTINNLPNVQQSGGFLCAFTLMGKTLITNATKTGPDTLMCTTPRTDLLLQIPSGQHYIQAKLSVRMTNGPDFVATDFEFYNCNRYQQCSQCVSAPFPCDWCVDGHRCTHDTAENCRNDILVTGLKRIGPSIRSGPGFCPKINTTAHGTTEILVPSGTKRNIKVKVENIARLIAQDRFVCQFNIEGRVTTVPAQLLGSDIYCDEMKFDYLGKQPNITAAFAVIWGSGKPLDNPEDVRVLVYQCARMADNCGECLALEPRFNCGWCESSGRCEVKDECAAPPWLDRSKPCPNPRITDFSPKSGPYEGGTNITISGINLGKTFEDIYDQVTVAGVPCNPIRALYKKTRQIVCEVDGPGTNEYRSAPVVVRVASFRAQSADSYEFVDPRISRIEPTRGPRSGGTHLRIIGDHMDAGSRVRAQLGDLPCEVRERAATYAVCVTAAAPRPGPQPLSMTFDRTRRHLAEPSYRYEEDPRVLEVSSGPNPQDKVPKGVPSGGVIITVRGENLLVVQRPRLAVQYAGDEFVSPCRVLGDELMECRSPAIPSHPRPQQIPAQRPENLHYGFIMDDVRSVRNLSAASGVRRFQLYPDPVYSPFEDEDGVKYYKSDYLTINGRNLNLACRDSDVTVRIGTEFCNVTSLSLNQLTCKPPKKAPLAIGADGQPTDEELPQVIVSIGSRLNYTIGRLSYAGLNPGGGTLPQPVIIGVAVAAFLLVLAVIAILIAYKRKSSESSRVLKNMQEQMDVLELRVAAECKEAFAELQTEMTDLTSDITGIGIPFLEYRAYCMKILFPSQEDHPVLQWANRPDLQRREKGLRLFGQLIINKTFLLLFIRTLESNRYFSMRDRVNVASLIMVTLQCRMEYSTDILKTLLNELIEKCTEGNGSHPKLLLRRTESVAEKMLSAWFTFLLYKFLRECAGEPLYLLYRAIKQQVDKGPVDAVTSEARYSLSEEKLIRQQIDFTYMTVYVSMPTQTVYVSGLDPHQDNVDIPVRVLNTDTISQTKEKSLDSIYRSTPFSMRPRKEDLDLEWRTGNSGRLILYDEDSTTKLESGWKKLNTLSHYRVPDGALLTLVPKQSSLYNISILSEKSDKSHKYETLNQAKYGGAQSPPLSRAMSPTNHESGIKVWHLVRHSESEQRDGERSNKMVSEIYLTRLLATKGTLQKFMDDLFETIFSTAHRGSALPLAIKYMFDFLDDQALLYGITDPDTVHTWKSNSLPLRFWVNLIKNPNFVFDIHKSNIVDSCLSVVAQTFMDSCSTTDNKLGKDSPSSKLLYAKDIPIYKEWVTKYYDDIKRMPAISDQDMNAMLAEESRLHQQEFNTNCALHELYVYADKYSGQLMANLEEDEFSSRQRLALKLEQVHKIMAGEPDP
ncbi:plexin-A2-like isoform X2 [Amphibalanus amphitrite]|uniref:plexin-A2-like isoform X2 n=1 Tax=Amphibalanus amphitrite TaxID=1232801 RepID=UPI001C910015|nr:plexin-A2-like isoform X2 [Amphibalanus amphitrite]